MNFQIIDDDFLNVNEFDATGEVTVTVGEDAYTVDLIGPQEIEDGSVVGLLAVVTLLDEDGEELPYGPVDADTEDAALKIATLAIEDEWDQMALAD